MLRGVLQGVGDYKGVGLSLIGEQGARLVCGAILAAAGLGVTGAYLGTPLSFIAMGLYCGRTACAATCGRSSTSPRAGGRHRRAGRGAQPVGARQARLGADRRADRHRGPAEHRHHRRQAPLRHAHRQLLQRGGGRRQGAHLGGDGRRLLPRARGLAAPGRRRGPAADPGAGAGHRRRVRGPGPAHLRRRLPAC